MEGDAPEYAEAIGFCATRQQQGDRGMVNLLHAERLSGKKVHLTPTLSQREGAPLNWRPSADAVAGNGRPLSWAPSADAVAGGGRTRRRLNDAALR